MTTEIAAPAAPKSLVQKLAEVMASVERVAKRGRNDYHGYNYATEADIAETIRGELASRHIMLIPGITKFHRESIGDKGSVLTMLEMSFTFLDGETGEQIERPWMGAGTDKEDKGLYKGITGAEKYFLLKTFLIPTGDDPERDGDAPRGKEKRRHPGQRLGYDLPPAIEERAKAREQGEQTPPAATGQATLARLAEESAARQTEEPPFQYEPEDERKTLLKQIQVVADSIGLSDADRKQAWSTYVGKGIAQKNADPAALTDLLGWLKTRAGQ